MEFIAGGVRFKPDKITKYEGEEWFTEFLDDVYYTLLDTENAEILLEYADDAQSPPDVVGRYRKIRNAGIMMRQLVKEGNTYLSGPVSEYRWIGSQFFENYVRLIYGTKICLDMGNKGILIDEKILADAARNVTVQTPFNLPSMASGSRHPGRDDGQGLNGYRATTLILDGRCCRN